MACQHQWGHYLLKGSLLPSDAFVSRHVITFAATVPNWPLFIVALPYATSYSSRYPNTDTDGGGNNKQSNQDLHAESLPFGQSSHWVALASLLALPSPLQQSVLSRPDRAVLPGAVVAIA